MMSPYEFHNRVFGRALVLMVGSDLSMAEARKKAIAELVAAEPKIKQGKYPRRAAPQAPHSPPPSADVRGELVGAKDRFFAKLSDYFRRHDANVARELAAKRDAKRAARAARRLAKANPAPEAARPANVVPLHRPDAPQPEIAPVSEFSGPLVYGGVGVSSATRLEDPNPTPATVNWRDSIERNERLQQQRGNKL
jgi:hypothetical protein